MHFAHSSSLPIAFIRQTSLKLMCKKRALTEELEA